MELALGQGQDSPALSQSNRGSCATLDLVLDGISRGETGSDTKGRIGVLKGMGFLIKILVAEGCVETNTSVVGIAEFRISPVLEVGQGIDAVDGANETVPVLSSRAGCSVGKDANSLRMINRGSIQNLV